MGCCKAVVVHATSDPGSHGKYVYVSFFFAQQLLTPCSDSYSGSYGKCFFLFSTPSALPPVSHRDMLKI